MDLFKYICKRFLYIVPIFLGISILIFVLFNVVCGDPTAVLLGKYANAKQMAELRHELGLDKSLFLQYLDVLKSIFTFDFGRSWKSKQVISTMILNGSKNSLTVTLPTFILGNLVSSSIALLVSSLRGSKLDKIVVFSCVAMMSISVLAYILFGQWFFAYKLGLFEICGYETGFPKFIPYVLMPVIIGIILNMGHDIRYYRALILDEIGQDYVRTAKAKGLSKSSVLFTHVLKNALIPILTNTVCQLPVLLVGSVIIENFFSIPGFGGIIVQAIFNSDFPVIKAATIVISIASVFFNVLADVIYTLIDPRIRLK